MASIKEDELLKAACHGLLLGCVLPALAYNLSRKKVLNCMVYMGLVGMEIYHIAGHLRDAHQLVELVEEENE